MMKPTFSLAGVTLLCVALGAVALVQRAEIERLSSLHSVTATSDREKRGKPAAEAVAVRVLERLKLMHDVARWKWNENKPIDDPEREAKLLDGIVRKAAERGIDVRFARRFFEDQFAAAKLVQRAHFEDWTQQGQGRFADVPDLATMQRPRIDAATDALLDALANAEWTPPASRSPRPGNGNLDWSPIVESASARFASPADPVRRAMRSLASP